MKVQGKVLVATGAGRGVGRDVVPEALRRKARVGGVDIARRARRAPRR
jgi:NAD(P)-dependent dehydrogenase (short-subunit alcohol dehydrogenase family)